MEKISIQRKQIFSLKLSLFISLLLIHINLFSQQTSIDKYTGLWNSPLSWSSSWGTGETIITSGISQDITINGFITYTGNISFDGSGGNLFINDTLIINGNLTLGSNNNITVNNSGILIVRGNLVLGNNTNIAANAYVIVTGDLSKSGAANQGTFTSNDTPSKVFIGGSIAGVPTGWASTGTGVLNCSASQEYSNSGCNYGNNIDILNDPILPFVQSSCGSITINTQPTNRTICSGNTSFSITATGATSYQWQVSSGGAFSNLSNSGVYSGVSTNTLTLTGPTSILNGYKYRCIAYTGTCSATSNAASFYYGVPASPGTISGSANVCSGTTGIFSVTNVPGVTYTWTYSGSGATITGNGSFSISIAFSSNATSGTLTVVPSNLCGTGTSSTFDLGISNPTTPQITGPTKVFAGRTQIYSTSPEKTSYNWIVSGGTIASGQGTNSIIVNWDNNPGSGSIQVSYVDNICTVSSGVVSITKSSFSLACYQYKRPVNIAGTMVSGGPYTNFPMVVNITDLSLRSISKGGHIAHNAGYDIYFSQNADGSTPLDYQLDYYDPVTGKLVVWVKIPTLSNVNSTIYLFYGNYSVTFDASTSNVWSNDYIGVFHMGNTLEDFGIYQNDGSNVGTAVTNNGMLGQGRDFVRAEKDFIQIDNEPAFNFTTQQTVSFWMKLDSYSASAWTDYMAKGDNANWRFVGNPGAKTMYYSFGTGGTNNGYTSDLESLVQISAGQWFYVVGTFNGSLATKIKTLYINGAQSGQISSNTQLPTSMQSYTVNNKPLLIGINSQADDQRAFDGIMDEIHISTQQKSAGWIATEYHNQGTPGNITLGTEAVNVIASASGGTASASPTSIYAREYSYLTVSGYTGTNVQWQWSTDNISFTDLEGKTTATSQQTDPLLTNTYFRAMVTNGGCPSASSSVLVNVNPPFITCATGKRKKITIPDANYTGSDNLINFPFLVKITDTDLRSTTNGGKVISANGWDIRFTASDGVSLLAHQVESYDATTGTITAWVQIPIVYATGNTEIFMNYGDVSLAASNPSTSATWTSDYKMVLHMSGTGNPTNNSQGAITTTNTGTTSYAAGKIDYAQDFNGNQYITLDKETNFDIANNGKITLSTWLFVDGWTANARIIDKGNIDKSNAFNTGVNDNSTNTGWSLSRDNSGNQINMWQQYQITGGAPQHIEARNNPGLATGGWHYLVATFDHETNNMIIYVDGSAASSTKNDPTNEMLINNDLNVRIGANANSPGNYFDGRMDEVRIQGVSRSADWIKFEYDNQNNPGSFITIGPEEGCNLGAPTAGTVSTDVNTLCIGQSANLKLTGYTGGIYWQKSTDGTTWSYITGANNSTHNTGPITQSTYYRASVSNCCEAFSTPVLITYVASAPPSVIITTNSPVCVNGSLNLSGAPTGMSSYSWTGPNAFSSSVIKPSVISNVTATNGGNYILTVVAPNGCKNSVTSTVIVNPTPIIGLITRTVCSGSTFNISPEDVTNGVIPSGTTYSWNLPVVTGGMTGGVNQTGSPDINGTLLNNTSTSQTATYSVTPVSGMCTGNSFNVTVSVTPTNTVSTALTTSSPCINTPLTNITHSTTGATNIGMATGLPTGVTASWASNTITISGTPTQSGTFSYSIPLNGGCGTVSATGSITVTARPITGDIYRKPNN